ncbi:hypothetical protein EYF80_063253 [Liparis tanakae]|uniref:Uncharacterized protein n=1 Tax=Liparis tanakae TaxID=230148 RepID=A0A4Z2EDG8_9TELE|nr:hypothetical protein EYF80_063253 [Liparis tanakae]
MERSSPPRLLASSPPRPRPSGCSCRDNKKERKRKREEERGRERSLPRTGEKTGDKTRGWRTEGGEHAVWMWG